MSVHSAKSMEAQSRQSIAEYAEEVRDDDIYIYIHIYIRKLFYEFHPATLCLPPDMTKKSNDRGFKHSHYKTPPPPSHTYP